MRYLSYSGVPADCERWNGIRKTQASELRLGIAEKVGEMKAHDLRHFIGCALVSGIDCSGAQSEAITGERFQARANCRTIQVDTTKFAVEVRTSLLKTTESGSKSKPNAKSSAK